MKKIFAILSLAVITATAEASILKLFHKDKKKDKQEVRLTPQQTQWESIKENPEYLYGEGWGKTVDDADNNALQALISKISVKISSVTTQTDQESVRGGDVIGNSDYQSKINTYAHATLTNTERIILAQDSTEAHVGRWIRRSEVEKIFAQRRMKINDFVSNAMQAEEEGRIDDALCLYYWALALVNSLQNPNEATFTEPNGPTHMLSVWLPSHMDAVFDNLKAEAKATSGNDVEVLITYRGKAVTSIGYTYFGGRGWSSVCKGRDGIAILSLAAGYLPQHYQLRYAYDYRSEAAADVELQSIMNLQKDIPMRASYVVVKGLEYSDTLCNRTLQVTSFSRNALDNTATYATTKVLDPNGEICALIKVKTPLQSLTFDADGMGVQKAVQRRGEVYVYVPQGTKTFSIFHETEGHLHNYAIPVAIRSGQTYIMKLETEPIPKKTEPTPEKTVPAPKKTVPLLTPVTAEPESDVRDTVTIETLTPEVITTPVPQHAHKVVPNIHEPVHQLISVDVYSLPVEMVGVEKPTGNYYIGKCEVTQALWQAVMGDNPSTDIDYDNPVENVSWYDCARFIQKLNSITGRKFRMPTEEEWHYASNGGSKSHGYLYSGSNNINAVAWYADNSGGSAHNVATKHPNELGIYDMSGNVWEWCKGYVRVGGGWGLPANSSRTSSRHVSKPDYKDRFVGLRLAADPDLAKDEP